jgi:CspA family cold shock protein
MPTGVVKFLNPEKGFGFIKQDDKTGTDLFVHKSEITGYITEGDRVEFEIGRGKKGLCATDVRKI